MYIKIRGKILFHWVIIAKNGQVLGTSETYYSKGNAVKAARKLARSMNIDYKEEK